MDTSNFRKIIDSFHQQMLETQAEITSVKLDEDKWSLKEIIGHLIDSASNNHQRFVWLQFGDLLDFPAYTAEEWIKAQKYNSLSWEVVVALWYNYNCLLLNFIENVDEATLKNVWVVGEDTITLEEMIDGYYKHSGIHIEHFNTRKKELQR